MKPLILVTLVLLMISASQGRVAWYGEREFEDTIASLEHQGYTINYITDINEKTLSVYDVLVVCLREVSPSQKEVILQFVEEGGGLLIIYDIALYPEIEDILSQYTLEKTAAVESPFLQSLLSDELVEELKKRVAVSEKGKGRIIAIGYDPVTAQALTLLGGENTVFVLGLDWLSQDWHVEKVQNMLVKNRIRTLIPVIVGIVLVILIGYFFLKRPRNIQTGLTEKEEEMRELKAKFVYGELSKEEYQRELKKLEK